MPVEFDFSRALAEVLRLRDAYDLILDSAERAADEVLRIWESGGAARVYLDAAGRAAVEAVGAGGALFRIEAEGSFPVVERLALTLAPPSRCGLHWPDVRELVYSFFASRLHLPRGEYSLALWFEALLSLVRFALLLYGEGSFAIAARCEQQEETVRLVVEVPR